MISISDAAEELVARPRPILCLDTCDFLDVVRSFAETESNHYNARAFHGLLPILVRFPERLQIIVSYLVRHEWDQNVSDVVKKVDEKVDPWLKEYGQRIEAITEACRLANVAPPDPPSSFASSPLTAGLVALARGVLDQAMVIKKDESCVERALGRVMDQKRPSHENLIKDSIHWEHYLELSRKLADAGHSQGRFFVSANKKDFWAGKHDPTIHLDLAVEMKAAGLQFSGRLDVALRRLGLET